MTIGFAATEDVLAPGRRVTLPPAGYKSRFSDSLNRDDLEFVPLTNVEITSLRDGKVSERPFVVLAKRHVRVSYPVTR